MSSRWTAAKFMSASQWSSKSGDHYNRSTYGLPPKSYGDLAFVQHMIASLSEQGKMAIVVPHGVLFRSGAEGKIRTGILKDDLGPVAKATFEVHTEMLLQSARHANLDNMRGVSANVMCGQFGYFGTGAFNVMLDLEAMEKSNLNAAMAKHTDIHDEAESIVMGHHEPVDDKCSLDKITVKNYLSAPDASRVTGEAICQDDDYDMGF